MRLLHYNVHGWRDAGGRSNVKDVADLIADVAPDVVSLVEVDEPWGRPAALAEVAEQSGLHWAFTPALEHRGGRRGYGNALLARRPFRALQQWPLLPARLYDGTEPSEPRAAVLASVDHDGGRLWVGATHLPCRDPALRAAAGRRLLELLDSVDGPWAVCGDFNQAPSAWVPEGVGVAPDPAPPTYPAHRPTTAIDYCLVGGGLGAGDARGEAIASTASDHLPVVITLV